MADQSDFLRALFDDEGAEGTVESAESEPAGGDNPTFKQVRDRIKRLENQLKKAEKANEELSVFKATVIREQTQTKVSEAFNRVYGDQAEAEKNTKLFFRGMAPDAEVTEEAVTEYLREFGPATPVVEGQTAPAPAVPDNSGGLAPTPAGTPPVPGFVDSESMMEMLKLGDFEGLARASEEGRLKKAEYPWPTEATG